MNAKKCKALRKMAKDMATNNLLSQETSYSEKIVKKPSYNTQGTLSIIDKVIKTLNPTTQRGTYKRMKSSTIL